MDIVYLDKMGIYRQWPEAHEIMSVATLKNEQCFSS